MKTMQNYPTGLLVLVEWLDSQRTEAVWSKELPEDTRRQVAYSAWICLFKE